MQSFGRAAEMAPDLRTGEAAVQKQLIKQSYLIAASASNAARSLRPTAALPSPAELEAQKLMTSAQELQTRHGQPVNPKPKPEPNAC